MKTAKDFFTKEQKNAILNAIKEAEKNTSGEIRVHIERKCKSEPLDRAAYIFEKLKMHKTKERNGILFYLAIEDRKFAILGDIGINKCVEENFWENIKNTMITKFKQSDFVDGLTTGIKMTGEKLKKYFPYKTDDVNELSDDISFA